MSPAPGLAYYNENDPATAAWLRELIRAGVIAPGDVDERDIRDVVPAELVGYAQCHFFAGVGAWSHALRCAGWPDARSVWTGSAPCQPFSAAGRGAGFADERHLWPAWFHLIGQCRPGIILGEQVASDDAKPWIDLVHDDLEAMGYAVGPLVLPAAGFGAPHPRHRIVFVAESDRIRRQMGPADSGRQAGFDSRPAVHRGPGLMGDPGGPGLARRQGESGDDGAELPTAQRAGRESGIVADPGGEGREEQRPDLRGVAAGGREEVLDQRPLHVGPLNGFWAGAGWLPCRDGRYRPAQPGIFPLVDGTPGGVVRGGDPGGPIDADATGEARALRLRGYGNAIVAPAAAEFIRAYMNVSNPNHRGPDRCS